MKEKFKLLNNDLVYNLDYDCFKVIEISKSKIYIKIKCLEFCRSLEFSEGSFCDHFNLITVDNTPISCRDKLMSMWGIFLDKEEILNYIDDMIEVFDVRIN